MVTAATSLSVVMNLYIPEYEAGPRFPVLLSRTKWDLLYTFIQARNTSLSELLAPAFAETSGSISAATGAPGLTFVV